MNKLKNTLKTLNDKHVADMRHYYHDQTVDPDWKRLFCETHEARGKILHILDDAIKIIGEDAIIINNLERRIADEATFLDTFCK